MFVHTITIKRQSAGGRRLGTALVLTAGALPATTAIGQEVVFDNMPDGYNANAGQCLFVERSAAACDEDFNCPIEYANGFEVEASGWLGLIELPIDWCSSACGQCAGGGHEECEFEIRVALYEDDGNGPDGLPARKLSEFCWTGDCGHDGVVQIDAADSYVEILQGTPYWLGVEYRYSQETANISWDQTRAGADDFADRVTRRDCEGWSPEGVHSAFRLTVLADTDADGFPDVWENNGIDVNGDGTVDFLADADPNRPDVYVEADSMTNHGPEPAVKDWVEAIFDDHGVNLHFQVDQRNLDSGEQWPGDQWAGDGTAGFTAFKLAHFGTLSEQGDPLIISWKERIYRYCVFATTTAHKPDRTGRGEIHGDDFMVTLGDDYWWDEERGLKNRTRAELQAGTFMHELGHTLGLRHGGADGINFKPNYYSVMSYTWQLPHSWMDADTWPLLPLDQSYRDGYSDHELPSLDESWLSENDPFGEVPADYADVKTVFSHPRFHHKEIGYADLDANFVNWDQISGDSEYSQNINNLGPNDDLNMNVLLGHDDWAALRYNFRDGSCHGDSFSYECLTGGGDDGELDAETDRVLARILPPPCPDDLFGLDPVVFYDSFESGSLGYWDTSGSTNGVACGAMSNGSWCSSVDTVPLSCSFSGRLAAEVTRQGVPYNLLAEIKRTVSGANRVSAALRFDAIQGSGGTGHSRFQIAVLDPDNEANTYKYGFSSTGDTGGDTTIQVEPGQVLDFTADFADDFLAKNGYELPGAAVLRIRSSVDYAEHDPGEQSRSCDVTIDNIVMSLATQSCPGDVDDDGTVGFGDLLALLAAWGPNPGHPADLDGDGIVGFADLLLLLAGWGPCPG